ncbi:uncharacterized protein [Pagrus major]|uniref:uncharacterized protein isoform X2 n=1 Tax=Pagrus major TaxID=143350 RepID=UPI003CC85076
MGTASTIGSRVQQDLRNKPSLMASSSLKMKMLQDSWTMSIPQPVMSLEEVSVEGSGQRRVKRLTSHQEKRTRRAWNSLCRHGVLLCALNMFRGEIFAYPLYLQKQIACKPVTFFAMDVACKYWPYLRRLAEKCPELQDLLTTRPFLSVFHAKAHDFKCEVKWSGAYQEGAGSTLGEEVEQCNAFLSRIAVTTKHMSKAGRIDMLTIMAMRWNQQKFDNLASTLARRYRKATITLQSQLHNLEAMKTEMDITDNQLESWIIDINEWAEATTSPNDADVAAVAS